MANRHARSYIICGIDRLGKDTLISNIQDRLGHHFVLHYSKPQALEFYGEDLLRYQHASFVSGFELMSARPSSVGLIFNRFHLGEAVYSNLYRGYDGNYVFDLEQTWGAEFMTDVTLVLLTTSDFSFIKDDGESFDFSRKEEEQEMFKKVFNKSAFRHKIMVDVANGKGGFKSPEDILNEVLQ